MKSRDAVFAAMAALVATLSPACTPIGHPRDEVVIMQTEAPRSMDPEDHTATYTGAVLNPIYEGLASFNQRLEIEPCLATGWTANATATEWTVHVRPNVFFHDGTPLDAAAVAASFHRLLDPSRGLAAASRFRPIMQDARALSPSTVQFRLKRPYSAFPSLLAIAKIVSPAEDAKGGLGRRAVGTGPYRFVEWKTGEYVLEEANDRYWGPKPAFRRLKWIWTTEPALMNMSLLAGETDLVNPLPPVFAQALGHSKKVTVVEGQNGAFFWIALNTKSKPLDDVRVRRALNYATDRRGLIVSQLRGYGVPANSPLSPADSEYDETVPAYEFDLSRAKALLSEAGYPNGFTLNVAVQEAQTNIVQAIQGMWANINVTLNIRRMETGVFAQSIFAGPQEKAAQDLGGVFASWASPSLDPEPQLGPLYRTQSWSPKGANLGFYSNPRLDSLLDDAAAELDSRKRKELYAEAQRIIMNDAPHVFLYYSRDLAARRRPLGHFWLFPGGLIEED